MRHLSLLLTFAFLVVLTSCNELANEPTTTTDTEQQVQKHLAESEAAVATAEKEIQDFENEWIGMRSTVTVPAGSVDALAAAIAEAGNGGTVVLASGDHTENGTLLIESRVIITGEPGATLLFPNAELPAPIPAEVIPSIHIRNTSRAWLKGFSISTGTNEGGRVGVLIQDAPRTRLEGLTIAGFQYGVLIDGGDRCQIISNTVSGVAADYPEAQASWGITNSTGRRTIIMRNEITGFNVGVFFSDQRGLAFSNTTTGGVIGYIWCTVPAWQVYPEGDAIVAAEPANGWRAYNNTAIGAAFNYLIVDGAKSSVSIQNESIAAGLYDFEIAGESQRFGFTTPPSSNSLVISVGGYIDATIKDCTGDNTIIGGTLIDTSADPCF